LPRVVEPWWRLPVHGVSLLVLGGLWLLTQRVQRSKEPVAARGLREN